MRETPSRTVLGRKSHYVPTRLNILYPDPTHEQRSSLNTCTTRKILRGMTQRCCTIRTRITSSRYFIIIAITTPIANSAREPPCICFATISVAVQSSSFYIMAFLLMLQSTPNHADHLVSDDLLLTCGFPYFERPITHVPTYSYIYESKGFHLF